MVGSVGELDIRGEVIIRTIDNFISEVCMWLGIKQGKYILSNCLCRASNKSLLFNAIIFHG